MKNETRVAGPWADHRIYMGQDLITNLYPWQQEIKDRCDAEPDDRSINVLYNPGGSIGKSKFCKYMAYHFKAPVIGWARTGDILNLVSKMPDRHVYLFDLARSRPKDWAKDDIPSAMEGIKNGLFMNTKYETSQVLMACPHIWMFCNTMPNLSSMSFDRWHIYRINSDRQLVVMGRREISAALAADKRRELSPERVEIDE